MRESTIIDQGGKLALLLSILLLLGLALAGCGNTATGSGDSSSYDSTPSDSTVSPSVSSTVSPSVSSTVSPSVSNTVYMTSSNFTVHSISVAVNKPVNFSDTMGGGGLHIICVGTGNGGTNTCLKTGNAPAGLLGKGTTIKSGETKVFTFTAPGTYHIICTVLKGMYIDVKAS